MNILVFVPAGVYFTAFHPKQRWCPGIVLSCFLSVLLEALQWIFAIGASDITDVISNTLGGALGVLLFLLLGKIAAGRRMKFINTFGLLIQGVFLLLWLLLFLANR